MAFDLKNSQTFKKIFNPYAIKSNSLQKKIEFTHVYMPWDNKKENELMFFLKSQICSEGSTVIPYMNFDQSPKTFSENEYKEIYDQANLHFNFGETYLLMSNFKVIHVFRVKTLLSDEAKIDNCISYFEGKKYNHWLEVDDVFVLDVNHLGTDEELEQVLKTFIYRDDQNIFGPLQKYSQSNRHHEAKWVQLNRKLTFDYYIKTCELKDNIFQDNWEEMARSTQHYLASAELIRQKCLFQRGTEKWSNLNQSFNDYKFALISEFNDVFVYPFVTAVMQFETLKEAWDKLDNQGHNKHLKYLLNELIEGKKEQVDQLEDFVFMAQHMKAMYYSLKRFFANKFHKEEFLVVENFLARQESLVESLSYKSMLEQIQDIIHLEHWVENVNTDIHSFSSNDFKSFNLKLSHVLSLILHGQTSENIFSQILELKVGKKTQVKSFSKEVRALLELKLKKSA